MTEKSRSAPKGRAGAGKAAAAGGGESEKDRGGTSASPRKMATGNQRTGSQNRKNATAARRSVADRPRGQSSELLLKAASQLLSQRSTIDVSLSEIAQESGLNSALISYHFGNKEGLLLALVRRDAENSLAQMEQLLAMDISPEQKIRLHIRGVINTYAKYPYLNRLMHMLLDGGNQQLAKRVTEFFIVPLVAAQQKIIDEGVAAGVMRRVDPMHFYFTSIGACDLIFHGRASLQHIFDTPELTQAVRDRYAEFVAETALRILKPE